MASQHVLVDASTLSLPSRRRVPDRVDDPKIEYRSQLVELLTERDVVPAAVGVEHDDRSRLTAGGERSQHAHHGRDADPTRDEAEPWPLVVIWAEHSMGAVDIHVGTRLEVSDGVGEVAQGLDAELDRTIGFAARRERKRVLRERERGTVDND